MRVAPVTNCAETQGPFAAGGGGNAHPATTNGEVIEMVGCPDTVTRGLGTVAWACPACEQRTVAPTCSRKPGIFFFVPFFRQSDVKQKTGDSHSPDLVP